MRLFSHPPVAAVGLLCLVFFTASPAAAQTFARRHPALIGSAIGAGVSFLAVCAGAGDWCQSKRGSDDPGLAEFLGTVATGTGALIGMGMGSSVAALKRDNRNGAATGAIIGLMTGVVTTFADGCRGSGDSCGSERVEAVLKGGLFMAIGAGIGALIDAGHSRSSSPQTGRRPAAVAVAPVLSRTTRGAMASVRW